MEDLSSHLIEQPYADSWICLQLRAGKTPSFVADELLKKWEKGRLTVEAKSSVGQFCLRHNFSGPLFRVLTHDLVTGQPTSWSLVFTLFSLCEIKLNKKLIDAILAGGTRDSQLVPLATTALSLGHSDGRWQKILDSEIKERLSEAKAQRDKLFEEMEIFKAEGMRAEMRQCLNQVLHLFPNDPQAQNVSSFLNERELDESMENLRKSVDRRRRPRNFKEPTPNWPELQEALSKNLDVSDFTSAYELVLGLQQMGFVSEALSLLQKFRSQWTTRDQLLEIELLLDAEDFAEALGLAQMMVKKYSEQPDVLEGALYLCAKAYYGLRDIEQGVSILKALLTHQPQYRDAALLISQWEKESV